MDSFSRDLHLFADDQEIGQGCRMVLSLRESLTLLPQLFSLEIHDLSASSAALLEASARLRVTCGASVLAEGERMESLTRLRDGLKVTSVTFSPSASFWKASVSLSLPAGLSVKDTIRAVLSNSSIPTAGSSSSAAPSSAFISFNGASIAVVNSSVSSSFTVPLASFFANDTRFSRPQAFFGRTCDALRSLAKTVNADVHLSAAGICVIGRDTPAPTLLLAPPDLLAAPVQTGNRLLLSTAMTGWPLGVRIQSVWNNIAREGRLLSRLIQADTRSGPWRSELEIEM